jgi:hypothetical protein
LDCRSGGEKTTVNPAIAKLARTAFEGARIEVKSSATKHHLPRYRVKCRMRPSVNHIRFTTKSANFGRFAITLLAAILAGFAWYIFDGVYFWPTGNRFAKELIRKSLETGGVVFVGDPSQMQSRVCFSPDLAEVHLLKSMFPGVPLRYQETDESTMWYVVMLSEDGNGINILGISHSTLRWNNYSSTEDQDKLNFDEDARPVCVSRVKISFFGEERIPTFRPDYSTNWRVE